MAYRKSERISEEDQGDGRQKHSDPEFHLPDVASARLTPLCQRKASKGFVVGFLNEFFAGLNKRAVEAVRQNPEILKHLPVDLGSGSPPGFDAGNVQDYFNEDGTPSPVFRLMKCAKASMETTDQFYRERLASLSKALGTPLPPNGLGLYKARLLASSFFVAAFALARPDNANEQDRLALMLHLIAFTPLRERAATPHLSIKTAEQIRLAFMTQAVEHIATVLIVGPVSEQERLTALMRLTNMFHDALSDALEEGHYTQSVYERNFDHVRDWTMTRLEEARNAVGHLG